VLGENHEEGDNLEDERAIDSLSRKNNFKKASAEEGQYVRRFDINRDEYQGPSDHETRHQMVLNDARQADKLQLHPMHH
jgi:hypothetical protein